MITARFDDLRPGRERSFALADPIGTVETDSASDVPAALAAVETAADRGLWAAGFVAYEAAPGLDPALAVRPASRSGDFAGLPVLWFGLFEHRRDVPPLEPPNEQPGEPAGATWRSATDRAAYFAAVGRIRERIAAGDTYQVNHTIRLRARIDPEEPGLHRDLCLAQRAGYAAYLDAGRYRVLSASPELFFRLDGDRITMRPMKGTAARGRWVEEDEGARGRLLGSPKERAENAMIVDLLRSDLGRVSLPGSVRVERLFDAEPYETVWQLTSTVSSTLRPGVGLPDVFRALFPSGSVTGAPKVATMRLIAGLEDSPRGVYCGAVGFVAPPGSGEPHASFNVAIRTVVIDSEFGLAEYGVGGAITHDSSAEAEFEELSAKARVLTARRPAFNLLETLRHAAGSGFRHLDRHLARLEGSARYFGFGLDIRDVEDALNKAAAELGGADGCVRLELSRDGSVRIAVSEPPSTPDVPVRLALHPEPVDPSEVWLYHKTTLRGRYDLLRSDRPDVDDIILVNTRGETTESTIANLAVELSGEWYTPPIGSGLLPGTYRAHLLDQGRLRERRITVDELRAATALALVSSVRGWRPAVLVP